MVPRSTILERNRPLGIPDVFDMPDLQNDVIGRGTGSPHTRPTPSPLAAAANAAAAGAAAGVGEQPDVSTTILAVKILWVETMELKLIRTRCFYKIEDTS